MRLTMTAPLKQEKRLLHRPTSVEENIDDNHYFWTRSERRKWLLTLLFGTAAVYASRTSVPLVIPAITEDRGWSKTDSGTVLSSFFWGYTLTQVIGGYLSDILGGEKIMLTAAVGWSLITFWMPQIVRLFSFKDTSICFIVFMRVLHGAFQGVHFPSMSSLSSQRLVDTERAAFFSVVTSGSAMGTLVTGTLGSYLLEHYGWPSVFYIIGSFGVLWTLLLRYYAVDVEKRKNILISLPSKLYSSPCSRERLPVPWMQIFRRSAFWSCVIGHACQNNCFFILLSWLPTYFHDTFPNAKGWIFNVVPWLLSVPCTFLGKWMCEQLLRKGYSVTSTRKIIEVICLGTQALGLSLIAKISTFHGALFCMTVTLGASGFHNNGIVVNPQDLAPKHSGSVFGMMNTVGAIPGFVGVYLAGYILELTKSWEAVFQTTALINMIGLVIFVIFGSGTPIT